MGRRLLLLGLALVWVAVLPFVAWADAAWLDQELRSWNMPEMAVPTPPEDTAALTGIPECQAQIRSAESAEDGALVGRGWALLGDPQQGDDIVLIPATSGWDGMCRPAGYQGFVFAGGVFAGTLSPAPTFSRTDGALVDMQLLGEDMLTATFVRYADSDPLCCPSLTGAQVSYRIERTARGPVVIPTEIGPAAER